jgi:hypothetical protein
MRNGQVSSKTSTIRVVARVGAVQEVLRPVPAGAKIIE